MHLTYTILWFVCKKFCLAYSSLWQFFFTKYITGNTLFAALLGLFLSFLLAKLSSFYPLYD